MDSKVALFILVIAVSISSVLAADIERLPFLIRPGRQSDDFTLSVIHLNDFHSRFEPISPEFTSCDPELVNTCVPYPCPRGREDTCIGGLARVSTAMRTLKQKWPDSIVLNGGDNFEGTLYYHVYRHTIMSFFTNQLPYDAITLGNHEFDQGVDNVKQFIRRLSAPVVAANINASADPEFRRLVKPSIVIRRKGRSIGIIGYLLNNTASITQAGGLSFGNEWEAVNREAERLKAKGVDIIVCVSHDGLNGDIEVAKRAPHVDLIVGGHSHTFLYSGPPPSDDLVTGDYPVVVVTQESGRKVLIVQAFAATKYLGHLLVTFDRKGEIVGWQGKPVLLDQSVKQDRRIVTLLGRWTPRVRQIGDRHSGFVNARLSQDDFECITGECNIGDVVADAFVDHTTRQGNTSAHATVGLVAGWCIVANLEQGNVTFEDVYNALPYEYTVDTFRIQGKHLLSALEAGVSGDGIFQVSGIVMEVDMRLPKNSRVQSARVRTSLSQKAQDYPKLDPDRTYQVVSSSISVSGGYANPHLRANHFDRIRGPMDHDVLHTYLQEHENLEQTMEDRIVMLGGRAHPRRYTGKILRNDQNSVHTSH